MNPGADPQASAPREVDFVPDGRVAGQAPDGLPVALRPGGPNYSKIFQISS